jgi:hypothetical protein
MKKFIFAFSVLLVFAVLQGCGDDPITPNPPPTLQGIFILHEGTFGNPQSYDYSFVNLSNDSVIPDVFRAANGYSLNSFPDGMVLYRDNFLYVTAQGTYLGQGTIYKINSDNNQLISSRNFGRNPYSLVITDNKIYVSNIAGSHVSVMDNNFNSINDSVPTGPNPSDMIYARGFVFVAKASYTTEKSLALINTVNNTVSKIFFSSTPVSVAENTGGIYVSSFSGKKLYVIDSSNTLSDSVTLNISESAIGEIVSGKSGELFITGYDTSLYSAKRVYKFNTISRQIDGSFNIQFTGTDDVYGISYDRIGNRLYITNSKGGAVDSELRVYATDGSLIKTYNTKGRFSKRVSLKY